ncbi:flagellar basal body rod modification protein [Paracoccus sp. Z330]|uniref:Basal-body rod modification protein FlgD n=1 Tax=Paracoccus onchidii TaxID=3017813 RepID=A0ABT4ZIS4_9RHOB|nr:flagellar hook capping FlgD N-terminal domain-containing protein [Paracoccus onchidii]MDB6179226.1 flagellar basal body rod modification protein [Paracoccus onchidii]
MIQAIGTSSSAAVTSTGTATSAAGAADFDTFLHMLTAQLKNQDPLNPMEGTEFAVQLATFSGVEQQTRTNQLLEQMVSQSGAGLGQLAEWIGKEARTTQPIWFGDTPLTLDIAPDPAADSVQLIARDRTGRELTREEIGPGAGQIEWYGKDGTGERLPEGQYSFEILSIRNGQTLRHDQVGAYGRIVEAQLGNSGTEVIFEGGSTARPDDITALRDGG